MNKLGHRVIGRQAAENAKAIEKARAQHFGHRVIGKIFQRRTEIADSEKDSRADPAARQAKREQAAKERSETKTKAAAIEAPITATLTELERALDSSPQFYETLYEAEKQRVDGARKGAMRLFLAFELDHGDRAERKTEIEQLLGG